MRRTMPPSWSVMSSSGARTGFSGLAFACSSSAMTVGDLGQARDVVAEEDHPSDLAVLDQGQQPGRRLEAVIAEDHPLARHLLRREPGRGATCRRTACRRTASRHARGGPGCGRALGRGIGARRGRRERKAPGGRGRYEEHRQGHSDNGAADPDPRRCPAHPAASPRAVRRGRPQWSWFVASVVGEAKRVMRRLRIPSVLRDGEWPAVVADPILPAHGPYTGQEAGRRTEHGGSVPRFDTDVRDRGDCRHAFPALPVGVKDIQ